MGSGLGLISHHATPAPSTVGWEMRYEGILAIAIVDNVPIAGISGPWPDGNYALTWWATRDRDLPPALEFHASMENARNRVEEVTASIARAA
jgi:hypothetical protein